MTIVIKVAKQKYGFVVIINLSFFLLSETNLLKFQLVHEAFYFSFLRFAKQHKKKDGTIFC